MFSEKPEFFFETPLSMTTQKSENKKTKKRSCFDGTHIRIQEPNEHENAYVNCKGFHSISVQGVCNHEGQY